MSEHANQPGRYFLAAFLLIFAVVIADQATKWFVMETMLRDRPQGAADFWTWFTTKEKVQFFLDQQEQYKSVTFNAFLDFRMVWNRGVSFGMFSSDSPAMPLVLMGFSLCVCAALFVWMAVARGRWLLAALPLVIGGALGNVCDRVRFGAVADFIDVHVGPYHWPAFNVADSCICIGAVLLVIHGFLDRGPQKLTEVAND